VRTKIATVVASAVALVAMALPAGADHSGSPSGQPYDKVIGHEFIAPILCASVCPYWTDDEQAACHSDPLAVPPPTGSYADWKFNLGLPAAASSTGVSFFVWGLSPAIDHDAFICFQRPHERAPGIWFIETSANGATELCGIAGFACAEKLEIVVCNDIGWSNLPAGFKWQCIPKNTPVTYRIWNWSDVLPAPAWVCWSREGIKPNSTGCAGS